MPVSPEQLKKFIELYSKEYKVVLDESRAQEELDKLSQLYKILYQEQKLPRKKS